MKPVIQNLKKYDFIMLFCALSASLLGMLFVYSATKSFDEHLKYIVVQGGAFLIGLFGMYIIAKIDYEDLAGVWPFFAGVGVFMLVLVLFIGTGGESTGTKGWIRFAGVGIQPAELAKVFFIITLSKHLYHIGNDVNYVKNVIFLALHLSVPVGLVILQPDMGTALVYIFIFVVMVFVAGIDIRYIIGALTAFSAFSVAAWYFLLSQYQRERFFAFLNPEASPGDYGYHVMQSKIAIGSGQIAGKGLFQGIQTQLGYLPAKQTDFIYAVIGEEAGLVGCVIVLILLMSLIARSVYIGKNARTMLGTYLCTGVAAMWLFHTFENIGMTVGLTPVTGIPLPFLSYGGSSLVTNLMALGLVLNVRMRKRTINF
ncbi:MAG: Rod shape-determining protein RodA [Firmicutes bacterium ADurb.Bin193]|nr:MAG: Rod shape-determining protein RodA [Firmicutes bacterium ADurb.Bin193]